MERIKFDDFVRLQRGFDLPDSKIIQGKYPVVASTSIKAFHNEYKVNAPVVVTGRSGSLGTVQYIDKDCWPLNTSLYAKNFHGNLPKYVFYYLQTMHLEQYNAGAGVPSLNQNHLHHLKIIVHDRLDQEKVVSILSAYDDLIEKNNRKIAILQEQAQEIYKEWFVRFRFPGHETTKFENGLPEGWRILQLGEIASISTGKCNRQDAEDFGEYPLFDRSQEIKKSTEWLKDCEAIIMPGEGTTFIPRYYVGKFNLHQRCYCIEPQYERIGLYIYYTLMLNRLYFLSVATGATVPSLRMNNFTSMKFIMPTNRLSVIFDSTVRKMINTIKVLEAANLRLCEQRDLLLPRLMSGKLKVR